MKEGRQKWQCRLESACDSANSAEVNKCRKISDKYLACLVDTINRKGHFSKLSQASLRVMKEEHCLQMMSPHNLQWCFRRRTPKLLWHFMQRFSSLSCFQGTTLRSKSSGGRRERERRREREEGRGRVGERGEREGGEREGGGREGGEKEREEGGKEREERGRKERRKRREGERRGERGERGEREGEKERYEAKSPSGTLVFR